MATKRKGQPSPEDWERKRPKGGPSGQLRRWYEGAVRREAHRQRLGCDRGSDEELLGIAHVAWSLGVDPLALLLDAAATALHSRCEPRRSSVGRKADLDQHFQDAYAVLIFRSLVAASRSAAATRNLTEEARREAIADAMTREVRKARNVADEESTNTAARLKDPQEGVRKWLAIKPRVVRALLAKFSAGPMKRVRASDHEALAAVLMKLDGWRVKDADEACALRKLVADRSTKMRRRARAARKVFVEIEAHLAE